MTHASQEQFQRETHFAARDLPQGIASGTFVMTDAGALPVDFLEPGMTVLTDDGPMTLRKVETRRFSGPCVTVAAGALGPDLPDQALELPAHLEVRLPSSGARVRLADIVDGVAFVPTQGLSLRLYRLHFDAETMVEAEGLSLPCTAARDGAAQAA
ncbi:Hint domain-containing protein [Albidovulum inexpectatum]|uniref:Hint domain-containing protein n=1 Tax=Albidovulum inexpectatum TaxID=196587 RepID=A0A2S5JJM4_9RHOB|nr:Hint domain-containing protein [Albidovulum inexpectatum]PPB81643.1 Hint domain-containing protein [Albidovulum inexpectatum]